jgi:arogenate dehydrogenase (NADP+), plant
MFGPESGKNSWSNLNFVFEKTRLAGVTYPNPQSTLNDPSSGMDAAFSIDRVERFLSLFEEEGCNMVELSCEEHDKAAANSQFITHLVGRILGRQVRGELKRRAALTSH